MQDSELEVPRPPAGSNARRLQMALRRAISLTTPSGRRLDKIRQRRAVTWTREPGRFEQHWERIITRLLMFGGASTGNSVNVYCNGDHLLEDLWQAIESAQRQIWFEMYTFEPDRVGTRTLDLLTSAAKRGCEVVLICDAVGSSNLTEQFLRPLRAAGAQIEIFNPLWRFRRRGPFLRRDHRKIIVIDGQTGFCGGMNISEEYAGHKHGNGRFQDCHVQLQGPCMRDLAAVFAATWRAITGKRHALPERPPPAGQTFLQVQASSGWKGRRSIQRALRLTTRKAVKQCYVTTPYFVPPPRLIRALNRAARRGVDVRVLTAGDCDVPIVALAARHIYGSLLKHGVRIYELFDVTLHAKTITIDGLYSTVGSFNLDTWSDKRNLEVNIAMVDAPVAGELEEQFRSNIAKATEITLDSWAKRPWWKRLLHWSAYQLLRL